MRGNRQRNAARASGQHAVLDPLHFRDLVYEPYAGDGEQDAEPQCENIDDHPVAIILVFPDALILLEVGDRACR